MQKGFNSDIVIKGQRYHVQTEDWGEKNPFLVSTIFCSGAVVKTVKVSYDEALKNGPGNDGQAIGLALKRQHNFVINQLQLG